MATVSVTQLEYVQDRSDKFYRVIELLRPRRLVTQWGRTGTAGQSNQLAPHHNSWSAVDRKLERGYAEVFRVEVTVDDAVCSAGLDEFTAEVGEAFESLWADKLLGGVRRSVTTAPGSKLVAGRGVVGSARRSRWGAELNHILAEHPSYASGDRSAHVLPAELCGALLGLEPYRHLGRGNPPMWDVAEFGALPDGADAGAATEAAVGLWEPGVEPSGLLAAVVAIVG